MSRPFRIPINNFRGGLAPGYFESDYPTAGSPSMAGKADSIDLTDPSYLAQGYGTEALTGSSSIQDSIRFLDEPISVGVTYAVGGSSIYKVTHDFGTDATSVTAVTGISGAEMSDVAFYNDKLYVSYNTSTNGVVATGAADGTSWATIRTDLDKSVEHRLMAGGKDVLYIANKNKVDMYDDVVSNTWTSGDLTLPTTHTIKDFFFSQEALWTLTNSPSDSTGARSTLFGWDTEQTSWQTEYNYRERVTTANKINGVVFVHYNSQGQNRLGTIDGETIRPLASYGGDSPEWYQVTSHKGYISWTSNSDILFWGSPESYLEPHTFPIITGDTMNSVASPFGFLIFNSVNDGTYSTNKQSGLANGFWKSLIFSLGGDNKSGLIEAIRLDYLPLPENGEMTIKLVDSKGSEKFSNTLTAQDVTSYYKSLSIPSNDIRMEIHFGGSNTDSIKVRSAIIRGKTTT